MIERFQVAAVVFNRPEIIFSRRAAPVHRGLFPLGPGRIIGEFDVFGRAVGDLCRQVQVVVGNARDATIAVCGQVAVVVVAVAACPG